MSFTKGVSFHHETNATSQPTINNNISINASNEVKTDVGGNPYATVEESHEVLYPPPSEQVALPNETEFLKKVLAHYMNQKLYWSGKYLVITAAELIELIELLLPGCGIDVVLSDVDVSCCGASRELPFDKVEAIWITKDDVRSNFKYAHSNLIAVFEEYRISVKYVLAA